MLKNASLIKEISIVWLINLKNRPARRAQALSQFASINFPWPLRIFESVTPEEPLGYETIGQRGCTESHKKCIELSLCEKAKNILIAEDDLDFSPDFSTYFEQYLELLFSQSADWDLFHFYNTGNKVPEFKILKNVPTYCTHFYLINGASFKKLLDLMTAEIVIDNLYNSLIPKISICSAGHQLVRQQLSTYNSDVNKQRMYKLRALSPKTNGVYL